MNPVSPEELKPGQILWFVDWLETYDRDVTESDVHRAAIHCATVVDVELMSFQKGLNGKPDDREFKVTFEEGNEYIVVYTGVREDAGYRFFLSKEAALESIREAYEEELETAEENLKKAQADVERAREYLASHPPQISKEASEKGFPGIP